jgi:hypothetical protein
MKTKNIQTLPATALFAFLIFLASCGSNDSKNKDSKANADTLVTQSTALKYLVVAPISLDSADSMAQKYITTTDDFEIPYNWYLEKDVAEYLLTNDHNIEIDGLRFYGALHLDNTDKVMSLIIVPVAKLGGPKNADDLIIPNKVFQYTKTCPNLCGAADQNQINISNKGIERTRSWFISKQDLESCFTSTTGNTVTYLKLRRHIENNKLNLSVVGVDEMNMHQEITDSVSKAGVVYPNSYSMDNIFSTPAK